MATTKRFNAALLADDLDRLGWLPIDLARAAKVADMTVYRFLSGERQTARTAKKLADAINQPITRYHFPRTSRRRAVA